MNNRDNCALAASTNPLARLTDEELAEVEPLSENVLMNALRDGCDAAEAFAQATSDGQLPPGNMRYA